jgi:hypothetical protein
MSQISDMRHVAYICIDCGLNPCPYQYRDCPNFPDEELEKEVRDWFAQSLIKGRN